MITPSQIREKKISTVESGGYDRGEVNELLLEVIESFESVYAENKELYRKMEVLANRIEEYRADEDSIKTALITAQKMASRVESDAKEKAEKALSDSAETAHQTVLDAKEKADKIVGEARDYVSQLTKEKEALANDIVEKAQKKANDAIDGAKLVSQNALDKAKSLADEIIEKAKAEKTYYEEIVTKLKDESDDFKKKLITVYEIQLEQLKDFSPEAVSDDEEEKKIESLENELNGLMMDIDELAEKSQSNDASLSENDEEQEAADDNADNEIDDADDEAVTDEAPQEEAQDEAAGEENDTDEVDDIIEEIESMDNSDFEEIEEEEITEEDVDNAINAFSSDEITPINDDAASIPVIEDEPEFESEPMPFENYFNVNREDPHNTDETISLIPPDDDDEDDSPKFKGFFKKKK